MLAVKSNFAGFVSGKTSVCPCPTVKVTDIAVKSSSSVKAKTIVFLESSIVASIVFAPSIAVTDINGVFDGSSPLSGSSSFEQEEKQEIMPAQQRNMSKFKIFAFITNWF